MSKTLPTARPAPSYRQPLEPGRSRTARMAYERMLSNVLEQDWEGLDPYLDLRDQIPEAWDTLERDVDVYEPREKVTLMLDRSVAKFFRAQGQGYQARINRVLGTYAQMKIAEVRLAEARLERFRAEERAREAGE
jgi:hypothetical protein